MRLLIIVQLGSATPARIAAIVPRLRATLQSMSKEPIEPAFRSATADLFGFCISSDMHVAQIKAALESPGSQYIADKLPILEGDDALLLLELGENFLGGKGFTRVATWLQRHH